MAKAMRGMERKEQVVAGRREPGVNFAVPAAPAVERSGGRRKLQRRRQIDPTTCEREYTIDELEFMQAVEQYKRASRRMFPTCSEILEVLRTLGYERRIGSAEALVV